MTTETQNYNLVPYQINESNIIEVTQIKDDVYLTQNQMAELFQVDRSVITKHLNNIFETGELDKNSTCAFFAQVQNEGGREVSRNIQKYNLDAILSVGYRVNSKRGVMFRKWATQVIKDRIIQEYGSKTCYSPSKYYFDYSFNELEQRIAILEDKHKNNISVVKEVLYSLMAKFEMFLERLENLTAEIKEHNKRIKRMEKKLTNVKTRNVKVLVGV